MRKHFYINHKLKQIRKSRFKFKKLNDFFQGINVPQSKNQTFSFDQTKFFIHLYNNWQEVVGPLLGKNTRPVRIAAKKLVIVTRHPAFTLELSYLSHEILNKILTFAPSLKNEILELKFVTSEIEFINAENQAHSQEDHRMNSSNLNGPQFKEAQNSKKALRKHSYDPHFRKTLLEKEKVFLEIEDEEIKQRLISLSLQMCENASSDSES